MKRKLKGLNIENFLKANEHKNIMLKKNLIFLKTILCLSYSSFKIFRSFY